MLLLGTMGLSTAGRPERAHAEEVLRVAWAQGIRRFDSADAYALNHDDMGHHERLLREVLPDAEVQTKGGLTRPDGQWVPDGRAKHLRAAIAASAERLGAPVPLYLLHAVDPRTPLATSLRALFRAQRAGELAAVGLCNVRRAQLDEARALGPVAAVQIGMSAFDDTGFRSGVAEVCLRDGIELQAHSPLGGRRRKRRAHPALREVARRHGVSAEQVALAWLMDLGIVPVVGASRVASVVDSAAARSLVLTDRDRADLDMGLPFGRQLRTPRAERAPRTTDGEVVIFVGMPAAGKSRAAKTWTDRGYERLNRDEEGGSLRKLAGRLEERLQAGARRVVLDNTYGSRGERNRVVETAWRHGLPVRCVWLTTDAAQAQRNAIGRLLARYGRLPERSEARAWAKTDPHVFGPDALFRFQRRFEPPQDDEGFEVIERLAFVPDAPPPGEVASFVTPDGWARWPAAAPPPRGDSWVWVGWTGRRASKGAEGPERPAQAYLCPHPPGPATCWCRPPLPGLVLQACHELGLDRSRCVLVGATAADARLAEAAGLPFVEVAGPAAP